ncbi:hypothetical protein [Moraxella bovis]|uniref:hypothetical protein n=1 Tax=Moraxella bovis TaxID=476 RepID=UPI0011C02A87|nr:hypothetical protein [Moraxella bovis]
MRSYPQSRPNTPQQPLAKSRRALGGSLDFSRAVRGVGVHVDNFGGVWGVELVQSVRSGRLVPMSVGCRITYNYVK